MANVATPTYSSNTDFNEVQNHVLGIVINLMNNYHITPDHVKNGYEYLSAIYENYYSQLPDDSTSSEETETSSDERSSDDETRSDSSEPEKTNNCPMFVSTRREFCHAMSKGIKICPKYSTCVNESCKNFHIEPQYLCPHLTRGSYCENTDCELIVIRPCRKGRRCNDRECSFRHNFQN